MSRRLTHAEKAARLLENAMTEIWAAQAAGEIPGINAAASAADLRRVIDTLREGDEP